MATIRNIGLVCLIIIISSVSFAQDTVTLANGEWAPYLGKDLKDYGVASHIATEAFRLVGINVEYKWYGDSWKRAFKDAADGKENGTLIWTRKPEREKVMLYSDVVIPGAKNVFFYLKDKPFHWKTIDDLTGKKIGGVLGYNYGTAVENAEKAGKLVLDRIAKEPNNLKKLLKGRIDLFLANEEIGLKLIQSELTPEEAKKITFDPKPVTEVTYHLLLNKKDPKNKKYLEMFNKGLKQLKDSGKFAEYLKEIK